MAYLYHPRDFHGTSRTIANIHGNQYQPESCENVIKIDLWCSTKVREQSRFPNPPHSPPTIQAVSTIPQIAHEMGIHLAPVHRQIHDLRYVRNIIRHTHE